MGIIININIFGRIGINININITGRIGISINININGRIGIIININIFGRIGISINININGRIGIIININIIIIVLEGIRMCLKRRVDIDYCPLYTNSGCEKERPHINWSMVTCQGSTRSELP